MENIKVSVVMNAEDAERIIEIDLSRDDCESIYAMSHVLAKSLGQLAEDVKSGMESVLNSVPKAPRLLLTIPFTSLAAANVIGMCSAAIFLGPSGPHREWVEPVLQNVGNAVRSYGIRLQIIINGKAVFSTVNA